MLGLRRNLIFVLISGFIVSACTTTGSTRQAPSKGLIEVKNWNIDQVWVKPGFAPASYADIMIEDNGIEFRSVESDNTPYSRSKNIFPLSGPDQSKYKQIIIDEFTKELSNIEGYGFSSEPGENVMTLDIKLVDIVSNIPPLTSSRSTVYLNEVGRATLVLSFRDSASGETLATIIDRRSAESYDGLGFKESTPFNNWAAVKQLAKHWAKGLRTGLDEMKKSPATPE